MSIELQNIINESKPILSRYKITKSFVFGSFARGEQNKYSDVDILISEFPSSMSLYDVVDLKQELEQSLSRSVDIVTERSIVHPKLRTFIMSNLIPIE